MKQKLISTIFWHRRLSSNLQHSFIPKVGKVVTLDNPQFILYKREKRYSISYHDKHIQSFHSKKIAEMVIIELENNWEYRMNLDIHLELRDYISRYIERIAYEIKI